MIQNIEWSLSTKSFCIIGHLAPFSKPETSATLTRYWQNERIWTQIPDCQPSSHLINVCLSVCLYFFSLFLGWPGWSHQSSWHWLTPAALQLSWRAWVQRGPGSSSTCSQQWHLLCFPHLLKHTALHRTRYTFACIYRMWNTSPDTQNSNFVINITVIGFLSFALRFLSVCQSVSLCLCSAQFLLNCA